MRFIEILEIYSFWRFIEISLLFNSSELRESYRLIDSADSDSKSENFESYV